MTDLEIPKLVLDPNTDDQLLEQYYQRTIAASQGSLTDRSPGSVLAALGEGSTFAIAELLYYLNMLPEASALETLRLAGVSRRAGTAATGSLKFLLTAPLQTPFIIPSGYVVPFSVAGATFQNSGYVLTENLVITSGSIEGTVSVEATDLGSVFNLPAYGLALTSTGLNYVQQIYNESPLTGGSDLETLEATVIRGQEALRSREVLVSITDYEQKAVDLLGSGAAKCIPFLGSNKVTEAVGQVHVFLIQANGTVPSPSTCQTIQVALQDLSFAASRTWVSPVALTDIEIDLVALVDQLGYDQANQIYLAIAGFLDPLAYPIGSDLRLKRLEYTVQAVTGVTELVSLLINRDPLNLPMPNPYTVPRLDTLAVTLTDRTGATDTYYFGLGTGNPD